jgi:hypothetical protein
MIIASHKRTIRHSEEILQSDNCGSFYCLTVFKPAAILEWTDHKQTANCPNCGIDSEVGDKSSYPVTDIDFLKQMNTYWF